MMKKLVVILFVFVSVSVSAQTRDTSSNSAKPRGMQFADVFAEHKGALIFINDKEYKGRIEDLKADSIDQISFIHGKDAVKIYSKKAAEGVFLINYKYAPPVDKIDLPLRKTEYKRPLYILDDKVITEEQMKAVKPDDIENVVELYELLSIAKYGKAGENGVLVITTKAAAKKQKEKN